MPVAHADPIRPIAGTPGMVELDRYLPFLIVATGNRLSSTASRAYLDRFGIGVTAWRVLANLKVAPGTTAQEICAASNLDKAAISRAVAGLVDSGDVTLAEAAGDRRKRPLHLTPKGAALHDRVLAVALERERRLLDGLAPYEVEALLRSLAIVHRNAQQLE